MAQGVIAAAMLISAGTGIYSAVSSKQAQQKALAEQEKSRDAANLTLEEAKKQTAMSKAELKKSQVAQQAKDKDRRAAGARSNALRAILAAPVEDDKKLTGTLG